MVLPEASTKRAEPLMRLGTVFGFEIHSDLELLALRPGAGERLEVVRAEVEGAGPHDELLVEIDQPGLLARIYANEDSYRMWVRAVGWFDVDPRLRRISVPAVGSSTRLEEILWGAPTMICFLERGDLSLHAAAVEVDGEAVVFVAPQAQGKTTLAAWFARLGHRVLSEDLTCVRFDDRPSVLPGPPTLRLRNDVARQLELGFARRLPGGEDRARYLLEGERQGDGGPVPVRAVVFLRRSESDLRLEAVKAARSVRELWRSSFRVRDDQDRRCFEQIADLVGEVPVWTLHRPLRIDALTATVETVLNRI